VAAALHAQAQKADDAGAGAQSGVPLRGPPGCGLSRPTWSLVKGSSARVSPIRLAIVVRQRFFGIPATDTDIISAQHFWTRGLETAGPGCYDAVAIARTAGFRNAGYEPASVMRRLSLNRSEPAKKSGQNIPKNRCRTTIAERIGETRAELPFIRDQVVCLSHDQAARSGPEEGGAG